ncbi:MAG TPA: hypothetical protein VK919_00330 [Solirubrobacterales bacterium]|nr:hypothetical protein [Solirubrobacterales bacterium]
MRPQRADIAAPELPNRVPWLNVTRRPRIADALREGPALVHFFDFAQLNAVRSLPYVLAWRARYAGAGLTVLGIHSPRFPFTADRRKLAAALRRLGVVHPVADDSGYAIWHDYGCRGWPSLFLWGSEGALRWAHFGEGAYRETEEAIQAELREAEPLRELPIPLDPLRPSDAPGAEVAPPSAEYFPGGSPAEPWPGGGEPLGVEYEGAGAYAAVDGAGKLRVRLDEGPQRVIGVDVAGLYELAEHERHERHRLELSPGPGVDVYALSFAAGPPA